MPPRQRAPAGTGYTPARPFQREGLSAPVQVAYCAQVMPAPHASDPRAPLLGLGAHLLSHDYVLPEVRFKGNAYGAWCSYDPLGSLLSFSSYRDPHIAQTLAVFGQAREWVRRADWTETDMHRAIIATTKREEQPIRPGMATGLALHRYLTGQTEALREARYSAVRAATVGSVRDATLSALEAGLPRRAVCVLSSRAKLEALSEQGAEQALVITDIAQ